MDRSRLIRRSLICLGWLVLWQAASLAIGNPLLFCGPLEALTALFERLPSPAFWMTVGTSLLRIGAGFLVAMCAGIALGLAAARWASVREALSPLVHVVKSTPVVCFIALLLVWFGAGPTTSIIVGLVSFPPFYFAMHEVRASRDVRIQEMLRVFQVSAWRRFACVSLPHATTYLRAAAKSAVGMAWKAGVAAELIGLPLSSIGEQVYLAKLSLDTESIIAWTAVVVFLGWLSERVIIALVDASARLPHLVLRRKTREALAQSTAASHDGTSAHAPGSGLSCSDACMSFGEAMVLDSFTHAFPPGERVCIMAPSGTGKTTLLRLLAGLAQPTGGQVEAASSTGLSMLFQETRLVEGLTVAENLALCARDRAELIRALRLVHALIPDEPDLFGKLPTQLSGGMQRRVELARALAHGGSVVLLDEPFAGLDAACRERSAELVRAAADGRTLIVATHEERDAALLDAGILHLA